VVFELGTENIFITLKVFFFFIFYFFYDYGIGFWKDGRGYYGISLLFKNL